MSSKFIAAADRCQAVQQFFNFTDGAVDGRLFSIKISPDVMEKPQRLLPFHDGDAGVDTLQEAVDEGRCLLRPQNPGTVRNQGHLLSLRSVLSRFTVVHHAPLRREIFLSLLMVAW